MRRRWLIAALLALPVLAALGYVLHFAVDVPWGDQWDIVPPLLDKTQQGTLTWADLAAPHNEHRILFPRLVMLGLARLTGWDTRAEMLFIQLLLLLSLLLLAAEARRTLPGSPAWLLPLPWLLFNLKQWETMLYGVQIAYLLPLLATLLALTLLRRLGDARRPWLPFAAAAAAAGLASFSLLAGLMAWPAGAVVLALGGGRERRRMLPAWLLAGLVAWSAYFHGLPGQATAASLGFALAHPLALARFMLALLGNALIARYAAALLAGLLVCALMLLLAVLLSRRCGWRENRFWAGTALFALLALGAVAAGRSWAGVEAAFAPRYTTFSLLLLAVLLSLPLSYQRGWLHGRRLHDKNVRQQQALRQVATASDAALAELHPDPRVVRRGARVLTTLRYSVFRRQTM